MASQSKATTSAQEPRVTNSKIVDHEYLEHELHEAIKAVLKPSIARSEADPRTTFHQQFQKEAEEYDRDFHKKYHDDLNTILIFSGLFSAVASAFVICVQTQILATTSPDKVILKVQAILCSALASSLLAAFLAMLGKQWLNSYTDGSFIDRNRHRELKMRGMITWRFKTLMECLPLILQASLLQLGYALGQYFWGVSRTVSSVIIAFTASGLAFFLFTIVAGTVSEGCPFQTPLSEFLRSFLERRGEDILTVFGKVWRSSGSKRPLGELIANHPRIPNFFIASDTDDQDNEIRSDSRCILTMLEMTKASDSIITAMAYIPEITWDSRLESVPLLPVYRVLRESLRRSADGKVFPREGARDRVFLSAKALLYMYLQCRCLRSGDKTPGKLVDYQRQPFAYTGANEDSDLRSTFHIIDWMLGFPSRIPWSEFKLSESHRHWLSYILQYRALDALRTRRRLTEDVRGFVRDTLGRSTSLDPAVSGCLFIAYLVIDHRTQDREHLIKDRSHQASELVDKVFLGLETLIEQGISADSISKADEALSIMAMVHDDRVGEKSFVLFKKVMSLVRNDDRLWELARLSMKGAFSPIARVPRVDNLKTILDFLHYHISSQRRSSFGDEPIYHSFRAIAGSSDDHSRQELAGYFTSPLLIDTILHALSNDVFKSLQEMAIILLPTLDHRLFASGFLDPGKAQAFVLAWWAAVECCRTGEPQQVHRAAAEVFFAIVDSPCLRGNLPPDAWEFTYSFQRTRLRGNFPPDPWEFTDSFQHILEANPPSLQRCKRNPDLFAFIEQTSPKVGLPFWMKMLWLEYGSLPSDLQDRVVEGTRKTLHKEYGPSGSGTIRTRHCKSWVAAFDTYLDDLKKRIARLEPSDPVVPGLLARQESVNKARTLLLQIWDDVDKKLKEEPPKWFWELEQGKT